MGVLSSAISARGISPRDMIGDVSILPAGAAVELCGRVIRSSAHGARSAGATIAHVLTVYGQRLLEVLAGA